MPLVEELSYFCANEPEIAKKHAAKRRNRQLHKTAEQVFFSFRELRRNDEKSTAGSG